MKKFCIFVDAVNYIEDNLCSDITQEDIAAAGDTMAAFRIGSDEFAIVTGTDDKTAAETTA